MELLLRVLGMLSDFVLFTYFSASILKIRKPALTVTAGLLSMVVFPVVVGGAVPKAILFPVALIVFWLYLRLGFEGRIKEKILVYCLSYIIVNASQTMCVSGLGLMGIRYEENMAFTVGVYTAFGFALMFLVTRTWKSISLVMSSGRYMTFFLLPISQFVMTVVFVYYFGKRDGVEPFDLNASHRVALVFCSVFLLSLFADGLFLDGMNRMAQNMKERERLQTLEMESELSYEYIKGMERDIEEMRRYRHDFVSSLTAVQTAVERIEGEGRDDALELICQMTDEVKSITGRRYCGCNIVNGILSREERRMVAQGIRCDLRAEVPEELGVRELDLCRVLTNMLENARQSCMRIEQPGKRSVAANMRVCEGYLYITVRNTRPPGELKLRSDKEDKKLHGLGLHIIRQITTRSNGELIITDEEDAVTMTAVMEWRKQQSKGDAKNEDSGL